MKTYTLQELEAAYPSRHLSVVPAIETMPEPLQESATEILDRYGVTEGSVREEIRRIYETPLAKGDGDRSSILRRFECALFEFGLSPEEVFTVCLSAGCNKFTSPRRLWEDVWRAKDHVSKKETMPQKRGTTTVEERKEWHLADIRGKQLAVEEIADESFAPPIFVDTLQDELDNPKDGPKYAIEQLLAYGGNALISAQRKTGKTVLTMNLAKAYADDELFLGRFSVAPLSPEGRILVMNYELTPEQFDDWAADLQIKNARRIAPLHLRGQGFRLTSPRARQWLIDHCKRLNVEAIIVDPKSRAFRGFGNENDNTDNGAFTDTLDEIKFQAGARELFLTNHMGWGEEERSRGASALEDWPDALWRLTKDKNDVRYFGAPLGRGVELEEGSLEYDPTTRALRYMDGGRSGQGNTKVEELVIAYVQEHPGCASADIDNNVKGASKQEVAKAKKRLISNGRIRTEIDGKKKLHFIRQIEIVDERARLW